eukprot:jgi/Mesvir1/26081/Mv06803-RA.1
MAATVAAVNKVKHSQIINVCKLLGQPNPYDGTNPSLWKPLQVRVCAMFAGLGMLDDLLGNGTLDPERQAAGYAGLTLIFDGELLLGIAQLEERTCSAAWKWICEHCEQPEHTVSFLNDLRRQLQAQKQQQGQTVGDYWTGNHTKWLQYLSLNGEMTAGVFRDNNQDGLLPELHPILAAIGLPKTCSLADYRAAIFLAEDRLKMQKAALGTPSTGSRSTPPASTSDTVDHSDWRGICNQAQVEPPLQALQTSWTC